MIVRHTFTVRDRDVVCGDRYSEVKAICAIMCDVVQSLSIPCWRS